jgi:glycosyltransferase involved in cell wall biosynthesis
VNQRILQFTETRYGGVGQYAERLSRGLESLGQESCLIVADEQSGSTRGGWAARLRRAVLNRVAMAPFHAVPREPLEVPSLGRESVTVCHFHGSSAWVHHGLASGLPPSRKVYWTIHDMWPLSGGCFVYDGCEGYRSGCLSCPILKSPFKGWARREWLLKRKMAEALSVTFIANSDWTADRIRKAGLFTGPVAVVPPIVEEGLLAEDPANLRPELGIDADRLVIGLASRALTDEFKGIPEFIRALAADEALARRFTVVLVGEGRIPVPDNLDVRFVGRIDGKDRLRAFYHTLDAFVSPSRMETFGMTLTEAQAAGRPVVAFDVGGVRDAVHPDLGWLVPAGDFDEMLCLLGNIDLHPGDHTDRTAILREWVRGRFSQSVVAARQLEIYNNHGQHQ